MILQLQDPSRHLSTYEEGRYFFTNAFKDQAHICCTCEDGKYLFEVARAEIFIFIMLGLRYFFGQI